MGTWRNHGNKIVPGLVVNHGATKIIAGLICLGS